MALPLPSSVVAFRLPSLLLLSSHVHWPPPLRPSICWFERALFICAAFTTSLRTPLTRATCGAGCVCVYIFVLKREKFDLFFYFFGDVC
jgi:hypothetical protein